MVINSRVHFASETHPLKARINKNERNFTPEILRIFVGFIARGKCSNVTGVLLVYYKIVPESAHVNLVGTVDEKCQDALHVELSFIKLLVLLFRADLVYLILLFSNLELTYLFTKHFEIFLLVQDLLLK